MLSEDLHCRSYSSNIWNIKAEQNNLCIGHKAELYSEELFAKLRKQTLCLRTKN